MQNRLFIAAREAMKFAYTPYSRFPVGVALLAGNGKIYAGCNVENASYPEGCCAETSAISNMIGCGQQEIVELAVVAKKLLRATPCGGCRQRIAEFGSADTRIHLCDENGVVETINLGALLPMSFKLGK